MPRSTDSAGVAAPQSHRPQELASPEWTTLQHSSEARARGASQPDARLKSPALAAWVPMDTFAELMEEPTHGSNHGRQRRTLPTDSEAAAGTRDWDELGLDKEVDFLRDGGWSLERGTAHRGVLTDDEYVNADVLRTAVERELGFTIDDVHAVYRQGPMSASQRELRARIDARLLALSRSGGSMLELARVFGWDISDDTGGGSRSKTMERALARAREAEAVAA